MPLKGKTIALVGAGNMGEALIRGLLATGTLTSRQIVATDIHPQRLELLETSFGVGVSSNNAAAVAEADVVLLAVKPQQMSEVLASFRDRMSPRKLVVSIAAGVTTARIENELGDTTPVVRAMPNMPAQVGVGAAALCKGRYATDEHLAVAEALLGAVGVTVRTEEAYLDAVTALSGTGPAYIFLIAEAMIKAGIELGLEEEMAKKLTLQTVLGSATLMVERGEEPEVLRHRVTSPGGTTQAALKVMSEGNLVDVFIDAVKAAARRSQELSGS